MDKQTIVREMQKSCGGATLLNIKEIARFMGVHYNTVPKILDGLEYIKVGNQKKYAATDVAVRLMERRSL